MKTNDVMYKLLRLLKLPVMMGACGSVALLLASGVGAVTGLDLSLTDVGAPVGIAAVAGLLAALVDVMVEINGEPR